MATADVLSPPVTDPLDLETPDGHEMIDGQLREKVVGKDASEIGTNVLGELYIHCKQTKAGKAFQGDTAFRCFPGRPRHVRKPDTSFVRRERAETIQPGPGDYPIPPDLVVEVCSPNETLREIKSKLSDWRSVGVPVIWIIEPESRTATAYVGKTVHEVNENEELPHGDLLPGFRLKLADVLLLPAPTEAGS